MPVVDRWPLPSRPLASGKAVRRSGRFFTSLPPAYRELAERIAARFQLPPALILAVIHTESSFQPWARSPKDAMGLMQLVPHKGGVDALRYLTGDPAASPPTRHQLADPEFNILLGTAYLRLVLDHYVPAGLPWEIRQDLVLAAYNWGPERVVRRLLGASPPTTLSEARSRLDRFAPLETRLYVRRVTDRLALYGGEGMLLGAAGWRPPWLAE
ncbi:MAG: transglycosylase SLT domain-containing protein [Candidatus Competibacteraceae bacterium]